MSESTILTSLLVVILLPLFSSLVTLLIPARYQWTVSILSTLLLLITAVVSIAVFLAGWNHSGRVIEVSWFQIGAYHQVAGVTLNDTTLLLLLVVSPVSFLIHLFSIGYMAGDKREGHYFSMLGFFTFSMLGLVVSSNLLMLFIFWELVGFSSYLLIGHWRERPATAIAATKAFLLNRVSDVVFIMGILIIWVNYDTVSITSLVASENNTWQTLASLCLLAGVVGKSAQFPLFNWLPSAMEGPTPVSALIHAATMVIAGVFLLVRVFPMLSPMALDVAAIVGSVTALSAALCATQQFDAKKVLAYSTISQLGLMVAAIGVGAYGPALLHLFTHAFFKAGLFLCVGVILYTLEHTTHTTKGLPDGDPQDIRNAGGLRKRLPVTFICFLICSASLAGLPFSSGFLSKDAMLASMVSVSHGSWHSIFPVITSLTSLLTVLYSFRLIWYLFLAPPKNISSAHSTEAPLVLLTPIVLLATFSLWWVVSINPFQYNNWLLTSIQPMVEHEAMVTGASAVALPLVCLIAWRWYRSRSERKTPSIAVLLHGLYLDKMNRVLFVNPTIKLAALTQSIDKQLLDGIVHRIVYVQVGIAHLIGWMDHVIVDGFVNAVARLAGITGSLARSLGAGKIQSYIFWSMFALIIFLFWALF
jgi:NADH-quinone oxidoreductase subunit L